MTVWCHTPTIFSKRYTLRFAGLIALCIALITTLIFADLVRSAPSTNKVINFQGRLLTSSGTTVPDGHYNMQFKIYEGGSGNATSNPGGSLRWTESYINNGNASGAVQVKNGFFSVSLGSISPSAPQLPLPNVVQSAVRPATFIESHSTSASQSTLLPN